jgi:hypothetical protein
MEKSVLKYKVLIHVDQVEEDQDPEDRAYFLAPGSEDSTQSGLPSPGSPGGGGGAGRTTRWLSWLSSMQDKRSGGGR